jgi:hypothetical protein
VRDEGLAQVEDAGEVDVDDAAPACLVDLHRLHGLRDAGIVEKNIDMPQGRDGGIGGTPARIGIGDVAPDAHMPGTELRGRILRALLVQIENGDPGAVCRKETGGCEPNSARARRAGDGGGSAFKQHRFLQ